LLDEKVWDDPDFRPALLVGVWLGNELAGWAMGALRRRAAGAIGYIKLIAVAPSLQSRGIGSRLLRHLEDCLFAGGVVEIRPFESNPNYLVPVVDPRYTRAMLMFASRGYEKFSETFNLSADLLNPNLDLASEEAALAAGGIHIRPATAADWPGVERFLQKWWPGWLREVSQAFQFAPPRAHLAWSDDQVIGFAACDGNNAGTGCFGPMGTDGAFRGKGIGAALLKRCLRDLREQGHRRAIIPWVGPIGFYAREAGAEVDRIFFRYRKMATRGS
jgi:GNAT superfamily N-acetyltransferase